MNALRPVIFALFALFALAGCNFPSGEAGGTPTINPTQARETAVARVTEFANQTGTVEAGGDPATETPQTPSPTPGEGTPSATPAPATSRPSSTPEPCDLAQPGNPIDVTIPDDTRMAPDTEFTKTWRLVNAGTCTWTNQYAVVWDSGDKLGINDVVFLSGSVPPGGTVDISVPMKAPSTPGTYQSNWKLRNAAGVLFGLEGGGPFWARIIVAAPTPTRTPTPTATTVPPTATPTPAVQVSGTANLVVGNQLNLDTLIINAGSGNDISYITDISDNHVINPLGSALLAVYGGGQPGLVNCMNSGLAAAGVTVENQPLGTYLCFQTDQGRFGRMQISGFDPETGALSLSVVTWQAQP